MLIRQHLVHTRLQPAALSDPNQKRSKKKQPLNTFLYIQSGISFIAPEPEFFIKILKRKNVNSYFNLFAFAVTPFSLLE